jgi:hypothetical protein
MIEVLFRECCENCHHISVEYNTVSGYTTRVTTIGCSHMSVCGKYLQEEPPAQDITVRGFANADR